MKSNFRNLLINAFFYLSLLAFIIITSSTKNKKTIVFTGDSLTAYFPIKEIFRNDEIRNFGVPGDSIEGVIKRCDSFLILHPAKIFIEIGINDLYQGDSCGKVLRHYKTFVSIVRLKAPETKIFIQSLLPASIRTRNGKHLLSTKAKEMNGLLKEFCSAEKIHFIDLYPYFEEKGLLKKEYDIGDGLHLTAAAYFAWKARMEKFVN